MRRIKCLGRCTLVSAIMSLSLPLQTTTSFSNAEELSDLLSSNVDQAIILLNERSGQERHAYVEEMLHLIDKDTSNLRWQAIQVACDIEPWTTGDPALDLKYQRLLWSLAADQSSVSPIKYANADCAAANRMDFYFDSAALVQDAIYDSLCEGESLEFLSPKAIAEQSEAVESVNREIISATNQLSARSYFPLRNSLRAALLLAHSAVATFRESPEEGRGLFSQAADSLRDWMAGNNLETSRSGWRFHSDIAVLSDLYGSLGGDEDARSRLSEHGSWPFAVDDEVFLSGVGEDLYNSVPKRYVDPIYVERLLPGAAFSRNDECERWFRRSFDTRPFAMHAVNCLDSVGELISAKVLARFDECMASFVARDWYVGFTSIPISKESTDVEWVQEAIAAELYELGELGKEVAGKIYVDREDGHFVVRTPNMYSDSEIHDLREVLEPKFPWAVYERQARY